MAVVAVQQIRRMRGGAQGQLMLASDRKLYVVKFQNNPQHVRVLANEFLATRLAEAVGLSVPVSDGGGNPVRRARPVHVVRRHTTHVPGDHESERVVVHLTDAGLRGQSIGQALDVGVPSKP